MLVLKIGLFGVSTLGTFELFRMVTKDKINIYFLPSLLIAIQTTILFFAGILNLLPETVVILYSVGFIGIIFCIYRKKDISFVKDYINVGYMFLLITLLVMSVYVKGKIFTDYDNFSHWSLVVKRMLEVNRYPNFEDTLISFQDYPLGSASYIYFFAKLVGISESVQMLAQIYMILASILPLFAFAKKNKSAIVLVMFSFTNFILVYNIRVTDLLVDTLLPLVGACGIVYVWTHCSKNCGKLEILFATFYMVQLVQIKNSGIFFAVIIAMLTLKYARENCELISGILSSIFPYFTYILWGKHCKYVFESALTSKHAVSVENYKAVFGDKTSADIHTIITSLLRFVTTWRDIWVVVGISAVIGILIWVFDKSLWKPFLHSSLVGALLYVCYQCGMLAMYLFSMPTWEAVRLASVDRYTKTILIVILYVNMVFVIRLLSEINIRKKFLTIISVGFLGVFFCYQYISMGQMQLAIQYVTDTTERDWIENVKEKYGIPDNDSYCVILPESDKGYAYYLIRYIFQSNDVEYLVGDGSVDLDAITARYILLYGQEDESVKTWIRNRYPEQYGNEVIIQEEK